MNASLHDTEDLSATDITRNSNYIRDKTQNKYSIILPWNLLSTVDEYFNKTSYKSI
jgi:hypothetical protein